MLRLKKQVPEKLKDTKQKYKLREKHEKNNKNNL